MALFWSLNKPQKNKQSKTWRDLRWPLFDDYLCINQPKQAVIMEKGKERRFDQGGAWGERDSIVFGGNRVGVL